MQAYQRYPFQPLTSIGSLVPYTVLDVELLGPTKGNKYALADIHVARLSDFGRNDVSFIARSHLGHILHPGDEVLGYDLARSNFNNDEFDKLNRNSIADVVLVKKCYRGRKKKKSRNWRLKTLDKDQGELLPRKQDQERIE